MKKIFTIVSALLIVTGLKAQKAGVQKETVKPVADTLLKNGAVKNNVATKELQKQAKIAPAIKYAPAIKKAAVTSQEFKNAPVLHKG